MTLPKNLIASLPYKIARDGVPEAYCPVPRCTPRHGMEKSWSLAQCSRTRRQAHRKCGCCVVAVSFRERGDLCFIGTTAGGEQAPLKWKRKDERRTGSPRCHSCNCSHSSIHVWQKEHIGSARFPQPVARRDEAGRGEARRGGRWRRRSARGTPSYFLLFLLLIQVLEELTL